MSNKIKFYKIRHLSTNLYFKPAGRLKGNLSKSGKTYSKRPSITFLGSKVYDNFNHVYIDVVASDWTIIEFAVSETAVIGF